MKKASIGLLIALFLFVSHAIHASPANKELLMRKLATIKSFQAGFEQKVTDAANNLVHEASGDLILAQPNKVRWHTQSPDEILLIATGSDVYQIDYFVEQVSVISQTDAVANNPMMLLTSNDPAEWAKFEVTSENGQFTITAIEESAIKQLTLEFADDMLAKIISVDSQEQRSELVFAEQLLNQPLSANVFDPQFPQGFFVDDQRR